MAEIIVEQALKELRDLFPDDKCEITYSTTGRMTVFVWGTTTGNTPYQQFRVEDETLSDCMAQVRAWKEENDG